MWELEWVWLHSCGSWNGCGSIVVGAGMGVVA